METCPIPPKHPGTDGPDAGAIPPDATRYACLCGAGAPLRAGEEARWLEPFFDLEFPPVPFPSRRVYLTAGEEGLRLLVLRHHVRLLETEVGRLFPEDRRRFMAGVQKTADFIVEACGGPELFTPRHGPMRMRERHFPFEIDERAREIWLRELLLAFDDTDFPEEIRQEYWEWMEPFSIRMINRRTSKRQPGRHPWADARGSLAQAIAAGEA